MEKINLGLCFFVVHLGLALAACPYHYYLRPRVIDPKTGKPVEEKRVIIVTAKRIDFVTPGENSQAPIYSYFPVEFKEQTEPELSFRNDDLFEEEEQPQTIPTRGPEVVTEATTKKQEVTEATTKKQEVTEATPKTDEEYDDYYDYDEQPKELTEAQKKALALLNSINFKEDVKNVTLVEHRVACAVDDGPCDEIGEGVKGIIDFLQTDRCDSCTSQNRGDLYSAILVVKHQLPHRYKQLLDKYEGGVEPIELEPF